MLLIRGKKLGNQNLLFLWVSKNELYIVDKYITKGNDLYPKVTKITISGINLDDPTTINRGFNLITDTRIYLDCNISTFTRNYLSIYSNDFVERSEVKIKNNT